MVERGYAQYAFDSNRELRGFSIKLAWHFAFSRGWYRTGSLRAVVLGYYALLRQMVRRSDGRLVLSRCVQCGIFFSTHSCNRGRRDLRCPFGCRREHERRTGLIRSRKHNASKRGRETKAANNQRAYYGKLGREVPNPQLRNVSSEPIVAAAAGTGGGDALSPLEERLVRMLAGHVREVIWGMTGTWESLGWVMELLRKGFRRRGLGGADRFGYFLGQLEQKPP